MTYDELAKAEIDAERYAEEELQKQLSALEDSYESTIDSLRQEIKQKDEFLKSGKPLLDIVFAEYPQFQNDYAKLKTAYIFIETDTGLDWNYSKQSLAEYFGNQKKDDEVIQWKHIEKLFTIKNRKITGLKDSFNQYRNTYQKESKDYEAIQKIIHN